MIVRILLMFLLVHHIAFAQTYSITGRIQNERGGPVPYASILLNQKNKGTSANEKGVFSLQLPAGSGSLHVRALGHQTATISFQMPADSVLNIVLKDETYLLEEIQIGAIEDPAYYKIRQAIKKRSAHLNESKSYHAQVYIKAIQRFLKAPKSILGVDLEDLYKEIGLDSNRTGIFYLSESESLIWSDPPNLFKEEMISSKMAGNPRGFSFNRASDMKINFYENHSEVINGLGQRPFISPIAENALSVYRYKLIGETEENGYIISKIQVIPKRKGDPAYTGHLYLIDDLWRLQGIELSLTKDAGTQFIDSLTIRQQFQPWSKDQWMVANTRFEFTAKILGFEIEGDYAAVFREFLDKSGLEKNQYKEALLITAGINQKDSSYWQNKRPVALTNEEMANYLKKDSLSARRQTVAYKDSLDKIQNKFNIRNIWSGYSYSNRAKRTTWEVGGLLSAVGFNTVEGVSISIPINYQIRKDTLRNRPLTVGLTTRYGVSNQRFNARLTTQLPIGEGNLRLSAGSDLRDLSHQESISPLVNTLYTLVDGHNYLKLYEHQSIEALWRHRMGGNVRYELNAQLAKRIALNNTNNYSFVPKANRSFTSNNPLNPNQDTLLFNTHHAAIWGFNVSYNFSNTYQTMPYGRTYLPSRHPNLSLSYRMGIPNVVESKVDFHYLQLELAQADRSLGLAGKYAYLIKAGHFLRNKSMFYPDLAHFSGRETLIDFEKEHQFMLLPYYTSFSKESFIEGHVRYNLSTLLTSKIPWVRTFKIQELVGIHGYTTTDQGRHLELQAGLKWGPVHLSYARTLHSTIPANPDKQGIRLGLRLL